jgi:hypothetical protein
MESMLKEKEDGIIGAVYTPLGKSIVDFLIEVYPDLHEQLVICDSVYSEMDKIAVSALETWRSNCQQGVPGYIATEIASNEAFEMVKNLNNRWFPEDNEEILD